MEKNMDELFKEIINEDYYKAKIKEAMTNKIIETIQYSANDIINQYVNSIFDTEFKLTISKYMETQKKELRKIIENKLKEEFLGIANRIEFKLHSWDTEKIIKNGLNVRGEE
jgi:hypothetical protein